MAITNEHEIRLGHRTLYYCYNIREGCYEAFAAADLSVHRSPIFNASNSKGVKIVPKLS
jgi:hypothetical protein